MTAPSAATTSFDALDGAAGDPLLAAAAAAAARYAQQPDTVVFVIRPGDDAQVVSGGGTGVLRAAVAVAAGAGNDRGWREAPDGTTVEVRPGSLPEVIASAATAAGVRSVHVGRVEIGGTTDLVAMWFQTTDVAPSTSSCDAALGSLRIAAQQGRELAADRAAAAAVAAPVIDVDVSSERTFDATDPRLDPVTGVLNAEMFEAVIQDFEGDEANLVVLDIDGFDDLVGRWGDAVGDAIMRTTADRLMLNSRGIDTVARLGRDRFAILFTDVARGDVLGIAKRLVGALHEKLDLVDGPADVTTTIAVAHQVGLVDLEEMIESACAAVESGKRAGAGRLVLAA